MVFIYGSSLGSIKNKILNGLIGDSIQEILNSPDKITEWLRRADGNQSLGIILDAIGINPYVSNDNSIKLKLSDDIKLYDIVNSDGVDNLVVNKSRDISIEESRKILVDSKIMKNLFFASFETYGKAFEDSFNDNFQFINRYRDILKSIEMVRFEIFDKKFTDRVNKLISDRSGTNKDGVFVEYNPTNSDLDSILMDLVNEGFGHAIRDINGGYHSFEKTERASSDRRYSLRTIHKSGNKGLDGTSANSLGIREFVSNVGAAPVTSIHNQDGWQIRYATIKENLGIQNIFDALISGLMNHKGAVTKYNEGYSIANSMHSILQSQMKDMENLLNSLTESEKDSIFNNMSNKKAEDIMFVYDKIRNPKDAVDALELTRGYKEEMGRTRTKELANPEVELNISLDRMLVNSKDIIESSAETINDISFGHLYATDLAEQYVGKLGGIKNENVSTETVFNAFFELIATATQKTRRYLDGKKPERKPWIASYTGAKYVVENKLANNEKEKTRIMKTFDTMMPNKIVSKEAKSKINGIIEKLVNCKP